MAGSEALVEAEASQIRVAFERPLVTIIIPARNEAHSIADCLKRVTSQSYANTEIVVIDGSSGDRTRELVHEAAERDSRIRLITNPDRVTPVALNRGLAEAKGSILVRIDAHAYPDLDYVDRIVRHLLSGRYAGVGGRKIALGGSTRISCVIAAALGSRFGVGGSIYHYVETPTLADHIPFGAYTVDLLRALGGWDERAVVNQDFELDYRIRKTGGALLLDPDIRIHWKSSLTLRSLAHQYRRYGKGKAIVARLHPRSLRPRHLLPIACLVWVACSAVVSIVVLSPFPLVGNAPYVLFLMASVIDRPLRASTKWSWVLAPVVLATMHLSWAVGFVQELGRAFLWRRQTNDPFRARDLSQAVE